MKLDYKEKDKSKRLDIINEVINQSPKQTKQSLEHMADYLLFTSDSGSTKNERNEEYPIITKNREVTLNKRSVSYDEIADSSEYGADIIYTMTNNNKSMLLDSKRTITDDDIENIPGMKDITESIESLTRQMDRASGKRKFDLKKQIISKHQERHILKTSHIGDMQNMPSSNTYSPMSFYSCDEDVYFDENGLPTSDAAITFFNQKHVSAIMQNYHGLKTACENDVGSDLYCLLLDFEDLMKRTFCEKYPVYYDVFKLRCEGYSNEDVALFIQDKYHVKHFEQYFSTLWRQKMPKMVVEQYQKEYLLYRCKNIKWKICGRCGKAKPLHQMFFPLNSSTDGFYSICKECRSTAGGAKNEVM